MFICLYYERYVKEHYILFLYYKSYTFIIIRIICSFKFEALSITSFIYIFYIYINLRGTSWKDKNKALVLKKRSISIKFFFIILYETISIISRKRTANLNGFSSINHSITLRVNFFTSTRQAPFGSQL